jgi:hypothetical protein
LARLDQLRCALHERFHAQLCKDTPRLFDQLCGALAVPPAAARHQQSCIVQIRTSQLRPRTSPTRHLDGFVKVVLGCLPLAVQRGSDAEDAWDEEHPSARKHHPARRRLRQGLLRGLDELRGTHAVAQFD